MSVTVQEFLENSNYFLNNLVRNQPHPSIKGVDALLFELTGSLSVGRMFQNIIRWTKHSVLDGWVWKTASDWWRELRLSRNQRDMVHKARALEAVGIERQRRQVAGLGTPIHYRFVWAKFLQALSHFFAVSVEQILSWMSGTGSSAPKNQKSENRDARKAEFGTDEMQNNKTHNPDQQDNVVVKESSPIPGIKLATAQVLIQKFGQERVQQVIAYAERKKANNIGGFIRKALEENWEIPLVKIEKESSAKEKDFTSGKYADFVNQDPPQPSRFGTVPAATLRYENPELPNSKTAQETWAIVYNQLELQLDRASFDTWLRPARFLGMNKGIFVVQVHNRYAQDMLQGRLYRNIRRIVGDIAGYPKNTLELRFEVIPQPSGRQSQLD